MESFQKLLMVHLQKKKFKAICIKNIAKENFLEQEEKHLKKV